MSETIIKATEKEVKAWLDTQVAVYHLEKQMLVLTEKRDFLSDDDNAMMPDIKIKNLSSCDHVHINNEAFRIVAKMFNLDVNVKDRGKDKTDFRYEFTFEYNGVKFLAIEAEEEYEKYGALA